MISKSGLLCVLVVSASLSGCVTEEFCGDLATFEHDHPYATSDLVIGVLAGLPCAEAMCWTVKASAQIYGTTSQICLGYEFGSCAIEYGSGEDTESCENAKHLAPDEIKIAFVIAERANSTFSVGDVENEIADFAPLSYIIIDDFSNAEWEFTIDEEGNVYHFF